MNSPIEQTARPIGDIIADINQLDSSQIERIVRYQQEHHLKFGEAAVALGLARREDVLWALSHQFKYPYQRTEPESVSSELVVATDPFDKTAEFFRDVRTQLLSCVFRPQGPRKLALAVCSPDSGDGKTFFAANLAVAFSQLAGRTLLVDADMRTPRQHGVFGVQESERGLSSVLSGRGEANVIRPIESLPNLYLLPVGVVPPNPLELIQGQAFDDLIQGVLARFDYVVLDTPAVSHGADARVIAEKAGAALAVARKNVTHVRSLRTLVSTLKRSTSVFSGVLLNDHVTA
ncbi:polysaccharide biosynthesis tyrosine autokinase [Aquabacterium fontiphilum]|jgi:chain length determinant protein tyrosine kinase EpsG|uniref:polysaccharide biosynthesis tyrosine autokinase n=1 Tax=Aquabacterium fontiphilum TaxID=450365 RepID=UPI0013765EFE|nr:polysaccharide biosynthesis tyrosine autokinase [Aquabacterium fontiphilum]NBD20654.1 polysaccharide biosynthesis tyrosine autokinase [Aquabacterium fontiphilum]